MLTGATIALAISIISVVRVPVEQDSSPLVVNDVSQLNPITVGIVIAPTTTQEILDVVRRSDGPITIGGARHSMGGQIATAGAVHIDMRHFDRILNFSPDEKVISVQAGTRWRQIQERIDPANLSVAIMQSYANFTVGGSLSVNAHGRYLGMGPLIVSVKSLKVVLADGSEVVANPLKNPKVFYGIIGGYGGLGVITEATLGLADNVKVIRRDRTMAIAEYPRYFQGEVRGAPGAIFHNGDIYPDEYDTVHAVTYVRTDEPVTVVGRLIPTNKSYRLERLGYWMIAEWPFGKAMRQHVVDPIAFRDEPVSWRNYEASYDVSELEPRARSTSTYALQEYFVPVGRFADFVDRMRDVFRRNEPNIINVSIRHATRDPGSLLAWARTDVFAFVIYYKQDTTATAREQVGAWTRELIDGALNVGGSYYLPYQLHATEEQFLRAYPGAGEFFALKCQLDPTGKFRNELWNKYGRFQYGCHGE